MRASIGVEFECASVRISCALWVNPTYKKHRRIGVTLTHIIPAEGFHRYYKKNIAYYPNSAKKPVPVC
jgi:hypothetical protein